jgi:hypothetical protein
MKSIALVIPVMCFLASFGMGASSQPLMPESRAEEGPHGRVGTTLFVVRAKSAQLVPPGRSSATATGAFVVDPTKLYIDYDLTYHGLEKGPPKSIALYNFDKGSNGALVHLLCGSGTTPCPNQPSGNMQGRWDGHGPVVLDPKLLGELASARVYLEIVGGNSQPEIRGQLEPNGAMLPSKNYVAHLAPASRSDAHGVGTAVMSEVYYPDGRVAVFYEVTVAGTKGSPQKAALVTMPPPTDERARPPTFKPENALPRARLAPSRQPKSGGTISGDYETRREQRDAVTASRMLRETNTEVGISVATSAFPQGELYGMFRRIH